MRALGLFALAVPALALAAPLSTQVIDGEGTYSTFGNQTFGPNGTQSRFGNRTYTPQRSYSTYGNTTYGSDGSTFQRFGNTTFGSNGTTSQTFGNTTFIDGPGGRHMTCQRFGIQTICN